MCRYPCRTAFLLLLPTNNRRQNGFVVSLENFIIIPAGVSAFILAFSRVTSFDFVSMISKRYPGFSLYGPHYADSGKQYIIEPHLYGGSSSIRFHTVLNIFDTHLLLSPASDTIGNFMCQLHIFLYRYAASLFSLQQRFFSSLKPTTRPSLFNTV